MDKGEKPAASNEQLLWLMIKHGEREKASKHTPCFWPQC
jgi:hypothetical protein